MTLRNPILPIIQSCWRRLSSGQQAENIFNLPWKKVNVLTSVTNRGAKRLSFSGLLKAQTSGYYRYISVLAAVFLSENNVHDNESSNFLREL